MGEGRRYVSDMERGKGSPPPPSVLSPPPAPIECFWHRSIFSVGFVTPFFFNLEGGDAVNYPPPGRWLKWLL